MTIALYVAATLAAVCWILSLIFREYSWVDRLWSVAPAVYAWIFCQAAAFPPRLLLMAVLISCWGARLTYNFARKGGYAPGGEDYRWQVVRAGMSGASWQLFNVVFICIVQNALLLGLAAPMWWAASYATPLGALDYTLATAFVVFLIGETIADEQQWRFQGDKKTRLARGEPVTEPFLTTGLFRYSRHPNFFCEMAMWCTIYGFSVAAGGGLLNPTVVGPAALVLIFLGSTPLTERISAQKYPGYADYQRRTSRLIPWFAGD